MYELESNDEKVYFKATAVADFELSEGQMREMVLFVEGGLSRMFPSDKSIYKASHKSTLILERARSGKIRGTNVLFPVVNRGPNHVGIDGVTYSLFESYLSEHRGEHVGWTLENMLKMFYFSAVTITTLGYGDIVPVSSWSRFLVAIESIAGIIIMGFFINSTIASGSKQ